MSELPQGAAPDAAPRGDSSSFAGQLDELADDMLMLMKRVKSIEAQQSQLLQRLDQLDGSLGQIGAATEREFVKLRRELLGERKYIAQMSTFSAVVTSLERLRTVYEELDPRIDPVAVTQIDALIQTLATMLRALGFAEFEPEVGEAFDPTRMECVGYAAGSANRVVRCVRPGFSCGEQIVRPAAVIIASPLAG